MSSWKNQLKINPIPKLLESDQPWVRYHTMRHLLDIPETEPEVLQARLAGSCHTPRCSRRLQKLKDGRDTP